MPKAYRPYLIVAVLVFLTFAALAIWGIPYFFTPTGLRGQASTFGSETAKARVTKIVDEGQINLNGRDQLYQVLRVEVLEGEFKGIPFDVDYGRRQLRSELFSLCPRR